MVDIVTTASEKISNKAAASDHILERLEDLADQYANECRPKPWVYIINDEEEAAQILLAMAATIKHTAEAIHNQLDKSSYVRIARQYRRAVVHGHALQTFRDMTADDQLEIYGLVLTVPRILPA